MKLSTKSRYGTRALIDIALHQEEQPIPLKAIARRQQISLFYLEQLIGPLIESGILRSTRGAAGGVYLVRPSAEIKLGEVIESLEGSLAMVGCVDDPKVCNRSQFCASRDVWIRLKKAMDDVLDSTTLQELVEEQKSKHMIFSP